MAAGTSSNGSPDVFALSLPADPAFGGIARLFAAGIARHFDIDDDLVGDLKIAISEAFTNALKAHARARIDQPIVLSVTHQTDALVFEISDAGGGFDEPVATDISRTPPSGLYEGSLGLIMIRSLFTGAEISRNPSGGTTVRLPLALRARAER